MKIFFSGSIRGGGQDSEIYSMLIEYLKKHGEVLTEHIDAGKSTANEARGDDYAIYALALEKLGKADVVIAEVSAPSIGVGYEIAHAERLGKRVLCLFRTDAGSRISAMVSGNRNLVVGRYSNLDEAFIHIDAFLKS